MNSLLTDNKLGYAKDIKASPEFNIKNGIFLFASERSSKVATYFALTDLSEKRSLVVAIVKGDQVELPLNNGVLTVSFPERGKVTLSWKNLEGDQSVTFNEVELVQYMEVRWVRQLVLNRQAGYLR